MENKPILEIGKRNLEQTCKNLKRGIEVGRTNQNRRFDSDLQNLDFNAGFPPCQPLFKYSDNHTLVGYSRSFWSGFMST